MKNYADPGGCYLPQPSVLVDNTLLDVHHVILNIILSLIKRLKKISWPHLIFGTKRALRNILFVMQYQPINSPSYFSTHLLCFALAKPTKTLALKVQKCCYAGCINLKQMFVLF